MTMKNVTTKEAFAVYRLLETAKLSKLDSTDVLAIIKNMKSLKKIIDEFSAIRDEVIEKMKDDEFKEMEKERTKLLGTKEKSDKLLKRVEKINAYFNEFNLKVSTVLNPDFIKENEVEIVLVSEDGLAKLAEENSLTVSDLMKISDLFIK